MTLSFKVSRQGHMIFFNIFDIRDLICHVTYVMTSNVHDGGQNTLFLPLFDNREFF